MALFDECMQQCAHKLLDTADIVRDRDITTVDVAPFAWPMPEPDFHVDINESVGERSAESLA